MAAWWLVVGGRAKVELLLDPGNAMFGCLVQDRNPFTSFVFSGLDHNDHRHKPIKHDTRWKRQSNRRRRRSSKCTSACDHRSHPMQRDSSTSMLPTTKRLPRTSQSTRPPMTSAGRLLRRSSSHGCLKRRLHSWTCSMALD
jgi:hypothetical protein